MPAQPASEATLHGRYLRAVLAGFLGIVAAWGAADVIMTAVATKPPVIAITTQFVEGLGNVMRRGFQYDMTYVNTLGMRREELPARVPGEVRILVLGDSVTFGSGIGQGEDWPAMLEKYLRARGVRATVMNAGEPGKTSAHMLAAVKYYLARTAVDLVLVQNAGNMLALGFNDSALASDPRALLARMFPHHASGSFRTAAACPDVSIMKDDSAAAEVALPSLIKRLSAHSPAINELAVLLTGRAPPRTLANPQLPAACVAPPTGSNYLAREALAMGQALEFTKGAARKLFFLRPTFVYSWAAGTSPVAHRADLPAAYREGFKGSWALVENVDRVFDFFAAAGAPLLDPIATVRRANAPPPDIATLYSDHTHFTAAGARVVAEAIGTELLARGIVGPATGAAWTHPGETAHTRDLRYPDLPRSASMAKAMAVGIAVTLATFLVGFALQLTIPGWAGRYPAASSMLGFFVAAAAVLVANNFSSDAHRWLSGVGVAAALVLVFAGRRLALRRAAWAALGTAACTVASTVVVIALLNHAIVKDWRHVQYLRIEAAWAEYLVPLRDRAVQLELVRRQIADGILRPHMIPRVATTQARVIDPAAPHLAAYAARLGSAPPEDAVVGVWAAFSGALAALGAGAAWALRRRRVLALLAAGAAAALFMGATLFMPSPLAMGLAAAFVVVALVLHGAHEEPRVAHGLLLLAAGAIAYFMPAPGFVAFIAILAVAASAYAWAGTRNGVETARASLLVVLVVLAARALVFDLAVADPRLYMLLRDVNQMAMAPFFL